MNRQPFPPTGCPALDNIFSFYELVEETADYFGLDVEPTDELSALEALPPVTLPTTEFDRRSNACCDKIAADLVRKHPRIYGRVRG